MQKKGEMHTTKITVLSSFKGAARDYSGDAALSKEARKFLRTFKKMFDAFLEAGFNYFDTAHGYLRGESEIALKECLTSRYPREDYVLVNKLTGSYFKTEEEIRPLGKECYGDGHIRLIQDYYHCISNGMPFPINGIEGAKVIRMILGAYQSKGERIPL